MIETTSMTISIKGEDCKRFRKALKIARSAAFAKSFPDRASGYNPTHDEMREMKEISLLCAEMLDMT